MNNFIQTVRHSLFARKNNTERIRLSDIRPARCVYYLAYALELIFFAVRGNFLPVGMRVLGINGWTLIYAAHMAASLVVMLLWSDRFRPMLSVSAVLMLAGFIPYVFLPVGYPRFFCGLAGYIGLGGVVTGARCGYAFASNNTERFFGIIFTFFSVMIVRMLSSLVPDTAVMTKIVPLILLALLFFCILRFREDDFTVKEETTEGDSKGLYWAFGFFLMYFIIEGYIGELTDSTNTFSYMFTILGMAVSGLILITVFCCLRFSTWHLWNLFFVMSIGMGVFAVLAPKIGSWSPSYFFCGMTYMGWPLCIYTLGCAQRRFASYRLLKKCTLIYVILAPITTFSNDWFVALLPEYLPWIVMAVTLTVSIVMLMFSPFSYKHLFSAIWISDIYKPDMEQIRSRVEETDRFEKYGLTPRQKEIAVFLLAGKTRRQIAGELSLSESTVKMHTAELYRRLGINSRIELFRMFGVSDESRAEQRTTDSPEE